MAELLKLARPLLSAAARLLPDHAGRAVGEVLEELLPCQLQVHDFARLHINPVQLEHSGAVLGCDRELMATGEHRMDGAWISVVVDDEHVASAFELVRFPDEGEGHRVPVRVEAQVVVLGNDARGFGLEP